MGRRVNKNVVATVTVMYTQYFILRWGGGRPRPAAGGGGGWGWGGGGCVGGGPRAGGAPGGGGGGAGGRLKEEGRPGIKQIED